MWDRKLAESEYIRKSLAKEVAKDMIMESIANSYYKLADSEEYENKFTEKELDLIYDELELQGKRIGKLLNRNYYSL